MIHRTIISMPRTKVLIVFCDAGILLRDMFNISKTMESLETLRFEVAHERS